MFGQSFRVRTFSFSILFLTAAFFGPAVTAQSTRTMDAAARRVDDFRKQSEKAERDQMGKEMSSRKATPEELRRSAAIKEQLKEDFESLQAEYNSLVTKLKTRAPFTLAETNEIGERIHARSLRLSKNLNLPALDPVEDSQKTNANRPEPTIKTLCLKIFAFITHPMFETPSAIDINSSTAARTSLEEIIWISDVLRQAK